ncbi:MAG: YIP1 family protein [Sulfitobacter sp.]
MSITNDIMATYRGPGRVINRFMRQGRNEVRALLFVLIAGLLVFIASAPFQAREAQFDPEGPLAVRLYWSAFLWIFLFPLLLYGFAALVWLVSKLARRQVTGYAVRLTLFWAILASSPVFLFLGLVAGMIGPGIQLQLVALVWLAVFGWFWFGGLIAAEQAA